MKNLIVGIVFNLSVQQLIPFLKSARQYYADKICIITSETNENILALYKKYNVDVHHTEVSNDRNIAFKERLYIVNNLLNTIYNDVDRVFFTDVRDVFFFGNIFDYTSNFDITFFSEPCVIEKCDINSRWYEMTYGSESLYNIKNELIVCNGTILATKSGMLHYTDCMISEIDSIEYVIDQPITNHLIFNKKIKNFEVRRHIEGPVGTFHHDANMSFCTLDNLSVVHQYDRCPTLSTYIANYCFFENRISNKEMYQLCTKLYNQDQELTLFRNYITKNKLGFLDNEHMVMWDKLVHNLPTNFRFIEIGVYKGQILTLVAILAERYKKQCTIYGVTPLSNVDDKYFRYDDVNYLDCITILHKTFDINFNENQIIKGMSTDDLVKEQILKLGSFDVIYVDGGHDYETVKSDIQLAKKISSKNSYIVMDDSATFSNFDGLNIFKGHLEVARATDDYLTNDVNFIEKSCVGHNRIFQKIV
jgi:hypothetical protein